MESVEDGQHVSESGVHTFLIVDLRGYTRFTLEHGDEAAAQLARRFAALCREAVAGAGGEVIELRGDEALAVFASPRAAIRAAGKLQRQQLDTAGSRLALPMGIGIDAGEAVPVEGGFRGAALNLAARLCSLAGPGEILVSETVAGLARRVSGMDYADRGAVQLKGFDAPVHVHEVRSTAPAAPQEPPAPGQTSEISLPLSTQALPIGGFLGTLPAGPFVGHQQDLAEMEGVIDDTAAGAGRLLLLMGEPGAGKTRLAQELTLRLRDRGFVVAAGRCYAGEVATPYFPWYDAMAILHDALPGAVRDGAARRWPHLSLLLRDRMPGVPVAREGSDDLHVIRAVAAYVAEAARAVPVAIMLDDLHWADSASLKLFAHLARSSRTGRILLLATYRDVEVGRHHPLESTLHELNREGLVHRVNVQQLGEVDTRALIGALTGQGDISDQFVRLIHTRTDGNPFFVHHVLRVLIERGDLFRQNGGWKRKEVVELAVPESVRAAIGQRLSRLTPSTQEVLHEASVLGQTFLFDVLQAMTGKTEGEVEGALEEAGSVGLVREAGADRFSFDHALTQQALYEELTARRRRRYHLAAGEALEAQPEGLQADRVSELAWHFVQADSPQPALAYSLAAAEAADRVFAHEDAINHYHTAAELAGELAEDARLATALLGLCAACIQVTRYDEGLAAGERAAQLYRELGDDEGERRAVAHLGRIDADLGETKRGIARVLGLLERLPDTAPSAGMADLYETLAALYQTSGRFPEKLRATQRYAEIARTLQDDGLIADAGMRMGGSLITVGRLDEGLATLEETIPIARRLNAVRTLALCYNNAADVHLWQGRFARCEEYRRYDVALAEQIANPSRIAFAHAWVSQIAFVRGDWRAAREHAERGVAIRDTVGLSNVTSYPVLFLGCLELFAGHASTAQAYLHEAWETAIRSKDVQALSLILNAQASAYLSQGQVEQAESIILEMQRHTGGAASEATFGELRFRLFPAWIACVRGDAEQAIELAIADANGWHARHLPFHGPVQHGQILGMAHALQGNWKAATAAFEAALAQVRPAGYPLQEGWLLLEYARVLLQQGDREAARACARAADALLRPLGAGLLIPSVDRLLQGLR